MKPGRAILLALAVGSPLWLRQFLIERELRRWQAQRDDELARFADEVNLSQVRYAKQIEKLLREWSGRIR